MNRLILLLPLIAIGGCSSFWKDIEGKAYDAVAEQVSDYCSAVTSTKPLKQMLKLEERIETRREIRQRGTQGPGPAPEQTVEHIGENTAYGDGPVFLIYCQYDEVPDEVWSDFIRIY